MKVIFGNIHETHFDQGTILSPATTQMKLFRKSRLRRGRGWVSGLFMWIGQLKTHSQLKTRYELCYLSFINGRGGQLETRGQLETNTR